ncbi:MAG: EF-hand domain-containing protein [Sphingomonas sp.]
MRHLALFMIALATAGCAARGGHPDFHRWPPTGGPGMPPEGAGPGMRPGGGLLFVSPMGEPFRAHSGDTPPQERWFTGADSDGDGAITLAEFVADAQRVFRLLDRKADDEIDPEDIKAYETVLLPEIRVAGAGGGGGGGGPRGPGGPGGGPGGGSADGSGERTGSRISSRGPGMGGGKQGAGRFGYLDYPQPVIAADRNFNRGIDPGEFTLAARQRFAMLDVNREGKLVRDELPRLRPARAGGPPRRPPE